MLYIMHQQGSHLCSNKTTDRILFVGLRIIYALHFMILCDCSKINQVSKRRNYNFILQNYTLATTFSGNSTGSTWFYGLGSFFQVPLDYTCPMLLIFQKLISSAPLVSHDQMGSYNVYTWVVIISALSILSLLLPTLTDKEQGSTAHKQQLNRYFLEMTERL